MKTNLRLKMALHCVVMVLTLSMLSCSSDEIEPVGTGTEHPDPKPDPKPDPTPDPDPEPEPDPVPESETPVGPSIFKMNSGGGEVTIGEDTFVADQYFDAYGEAYKNDMITEIADTDQDVLYYTERNSVKIRGNFAYAIPVSNGTYTVKLYFAEIYWGAPGVDNAEGGVGLRVFDVEMEGENKINNIDLYKEAGALKAITRMYDVPVTDGVLNISFEASQDKPKLAALEIFGNGTIGG